MRRKKILKLIDRLAWGLMTGFGVQHWLWERCPCWDYPSRRQQFIMLCTLLPLCIVSLIYTLAVAPFCLAIAALLDWMNHENAI